MTSLNTSLVKSSDGTSETSLSNQFLSKALITNDAETDTIRYSLNISSITDNGTGDHSANYTNQYNTAYVACTTSGRISESHTGGSFQIGYTSNMRLSSKYIPTHAMSDSVINGYSFGELA